MKSGMRVRSEDKRSDTNDSNERKEISRQRNFGRMKSGKRVRSEDKRSNTNDSNERKEISRGGISDG